VQSVTDTPSTLRQTAPAPAADTARG
jgi:hypothetical protein